MEHRIEIPSQPEQGHEPYQSICWILLQILLYIDTYIPFPINFPVLHGMRNVAGLNNVLNDN